MGCLAALSFEIYEHGLAFGDVDFLREISLYGLIVPSITWLLLTVLANNMTRHANSQAVFDLYRQLTQQLEQYQEWDGLVRFVTQFPGTIFLVDHVSLFVYDHRQARPQLVSAWSRTADGVSPERNVCYDMCRTCLLSRMPGLRRAPECRLISSMAEAPQGDEFCLPLVYRGVLVGVLWLRCQPGQALTPAQIDLMNSIATRIALAMTLSLAWPRQMAQARAEAQADERQRIAYELHNSLAQDVSFLHLNLDRLSRDAERAEDESLRQELELMRDVANDAYVQIRDNVSFLRSWKHTDLAQVISDYARAVARRTGLDIALRSEGMLTPFSAEACQRIFGFVQEGLRNIERHAQARQVRIGLSWSADDLRVDLVDDGIGFDPAAVSDGHYGLAMMDEWLRRLGGQLHIESAPGRGTRLRISIPLSEAHTVARDDDRLNVPQSPSPAFGSAMQPSQPPGEPAIAKPR